MVRRRHRPPSQVMPGGRSLQITEHKRATFWNNAGHLVIFQCMFIFSEISMLLLLLLLPCFPIVVCTMNAAYAASWNQRIALGTQGRDTTANMLYNTWMRHYIQIRSALRTFLRLTSQETTLYCFLQSMHSCLLHIQSSMIGPTKVLGLGRNKKIWIILVWRWS